MQQAAQYRQSLLFPEPPASRVLPTLGEQSDIRYYRTVPKAVLNTPEATGMDFWSINPYVGCAFGCAYCYARYAHRYVMERAASKEVLDQGLSADMQAMPPWLAFERRIFVKESAPDILRKTLRTGSERHLQLVRGTALLIGSATDPYQPAERRFRVTRRILEVLAEHPGMNLVIISKSPLVTRDIDLLTKISRNSRVCVHLSLITLDRELARKLEPRAPTPEARLRALERLRNAGIDAGINCMPVLPGITDKPEHLEALVKRAAEAGATYVGACALRLQSAARKRYLPFIEQEFPHLAEKYRGTYGNSVHAGDKYRAGLSKFFHALCAKYGVRSWSGSDDDEGGAEAQVAALQMELWSEGERGRERAAAGE